MKHLIYVIQQKQAELEYAKTALLHALSNGTRAEQLHTLDHVNTLRTELKAYQRLLNIINEENDA